MSGLGRGDGRQTIFRLKGEGLQEALSMPLAHGRARKFAWIFCMEGAAIVRNEAYPVHATGSMMTADHENGDTTMQYDEVVLTRRSIRGYKPDPVPEELIQDVLRLAMRAPSSYNSQPYHFHVITGEPLDVIRARSVERIRAGHTDAREFRTGQPFAGAHRDRQVAVAKQLLGAMGIARGDAQGRDAWVLRGFRQFDAPVCVIITYDRLLGDSDDTAFDCGAVANSLVNAAWSRGLGAVINSQGIMQSPIVSEVARVPDDQVILKSIALGWPDLSFAANGVVSERRSVHEAATFIGFDS
jgi:nitroreductase